MRMGYLVVKPKILGVHFFMNGCLVSLKNQALIHIIIINYIINYCSVLALVNGVRYTKSRNKMQMSTLKAIKKIRLNLIVSIFK